jgi:hypothetical protein
VITPTGDGFVKITNRCCGRAVSCLGGSTADKTPIHLWDFLGTEPDQEWRIEQVEERVVIDAGNVIARPTPYMTGMCLEDVNHSVYGGIDSQMIFGESFQEPAPFDPTALYKIINEKSGTALSVRQQGHANASLAVIRAFTDTPDQRWRITPVGAGFCSIVNNHNGKALSTLDGKAVDGTPVHLWDYLGFMPDQHWAIRDPGNGNYHLMNRTSRRVAACLGEDTRDNTRLELQDKTFDVSRKHQEWALLPLAPVTRPEVSGMWKAFTRGSAAGGFALVTTAPHHGSQSQRVIFTAGDGVVGIENRGLNHWA